MHKHTPYILRAAGIEPATKPWQGFVLPLNYAREYMYTRAHFQMVSSQALQVYTLQLCQRYTVYPEGDYTCVLK